MAKSVLPAGEVADDHTTTKPPSASAATAGLYWVPGVKVLTWNSPPSGTPSASTSRPWMLRSELSPGEPEMLFHTTAKSPDGRAATAGSIGRRGCRR